MNQNLFSFLLILLLFSACQSTTEKQVLSNGHQTQDLVGDSENNSIDKPFFKVKNQRDYSSEFLIALEKLATDMNTLITLEENIATIDGEKIKLLSIEKIGQSKILKGTNNNFDIELELTAENYSTLNYTAIIKQGEKTHTLSKQIYLSPSFFLASESLENPKDGISFLATSYSNKTSNCYTEIIIGSTDEDDKLKGIFISDCSSLLGALNSSNTPFLSE